LIGVRTSPFPYDDFDAPAVIDTVEERKPSEEQEDLQSAQLEAEQAVRQEAFDEGFRAGAASRDAEIDDALDRAEKLVADSVQTMCANVERAATEAADALAGLLFGVLLTALPATYARHGSAEAAAFAGAILPLLRPEPEIAIRTHAQAQAELMAVISELSPDLRDRIALRPDSTMSPGDVEIAWKDGRAGRNAAEIFAEITAILERFDLAFPLDEPSPSIAA
jgi:flagellar biosynthesis/type III secretory pathway protein FliH